MSCELLEVRILSVQVIDGGGRKSFHYQLISVSTTSSGRTSASVWGPVERSHQFDGTISITARMQASVVCRGGTMHWHARLCACTVALDVRTGRTWTTKLRLNGVACRDQVVLATSRDSRRLSVIRWFKERQVIQVWELTGGDQWILRRVVDVRKLVPQPYPSVWLSVFCPRSGCLRVQVNGQDVLIDVDRGSSSHIHWDMLRCRPYHIDWSSYWTMCSSKMMYF